MPAGLWAGAFAAAAATTYSEAIGSACGWGAFTVGVVLVSGMDDPPPPHLRKRGPLMDVGALVGGGVALLVDLLSWQARATNRRSDFLAVTGRLDKEVKEERTQRKLLTRAYLDLVQWARRVGPGTPAGPAPEPPAELDLTPWRL